MAVLLGKLQFSSNTYRKYDNSRLLYNRHEDFIYTSTIWNTWLLLLNKFSFFFIKFIKNFAPNNTNKNKFKFEQNNIRKLKQIKFEAKIKNKKFATHTVVKLIKILQTVAKNKNSKLFKLRCLSPTIQNFFEIKFCEISLPNKSQNKKCGMLATHPRNFIVNRKQIKLIKRKKITFLKKNIFFIFLQNLNTKHLLCN